MKRRPTKISFWTIFKIAGFLLFSLNGWLRVSETIRYRDMLVQLQVFPGGAYQVLTGVLMGLSGLAVAAALGLRWHSAHVLAAAVAACGLIGAWVDRLWLSRSPDARVNAPFLLVFSLAVMVILLLPLAPQGRVPQDEHK